MCTFCAAKKLWNEERAGMNFVGAPFAPLKCSEELIRQCAWTLRTSKTMWDEKKVVRSFASALCVPLK